MGGYWGCFWCVCDRYWSAFWLAERLTPLFTAFFQHWSIFVTSRYSDKHTHFTQQFPRCVEVTKKERSALLSCPLFYFFLIFFHFSHFSCEQLSPTPTNSFEETLSESVHRCSQVNNACRLASRYEKPSSLLLVHIAEWHIKKPVQLCVSLYLRILRLLLRSLLKKMPPRK